MGDVENGGSTNRSNESAAAAAASLQQDGHVKFIEGGAGATGGHRSAAATATRTQTMGWCDDKVPATVANAAAAVVSVVIAWCLLYVTTSPELMAVPGGSLASVFMVYVAGTVAGRLITKVGGLPPLLGMMLAGIALRNTGLYTVTGWCTHLVSTMREAALTVILIKGGLELNAGQLRRLSGVVARLTLLPCIAEAVAAGTAAHLILPNFSWVWGLTLGFTLSAVSPAVLVPSLYRMKRLGYGEIKGVNTLLIAASSLDDIVSISAFGILLGVLFSSGSLTSKITQGPIDVSIGTVLGLVWGFVLIFVPASPWAVIYNEQNGEDKTVDKSQIERSIIAKRTFLLGAGGFLAVTGSTWCGYPGAGPLACIISALVAATGWRRRTKRQLIDNPVIAIDGGEDATPQDDDDDPIVKVFELAWVGLQPVLFAFIGTDLDFKLLKGGDMIFLGLLVLAFGLAIRLIVTTCSVAGSGFSRKEVLFVNIAWLPKATVQAALAPVALEIARNLGTADDVECATRLVTIAVLSILLTAPIGAFGIQLFGPRLLPKSA